MSQPPDDDPERPFFATAAKGTEGVLRDELKQLGLRGVKASRGGVHFGGGFRNAVRVCLHSRIALRVLERQASFSADSPEALYDGVRAIPFERVLDARRTLCVDAHVRDAASRNSAYAAQLVKDAIVDRLRQKLGARPSVDKRDPDVRVALHWVGSRASVALDVAGDSLHARGYRAAAGPAPLRETLAAAMLWLVDWDREQPLLDPMCGAGTIAIEAACWARGLAPGLARARFGFERWLEHGDAERRATLALREEARTAARPPAQVPPIFARDVDPRALELARDNARRAGVELVLARADARELQKEHERAWLVTNPPYGERLAKSDMLAPELARAFARLSGYRVCALCGDRELARAMRKQPVIEHALWNGALECRLFGWEI